MQMKLILKSVTNWIDSDPLRKWSTMNRQRKFFQSMKDQRTVHRLVARRQFQHRWQAQMVKTYVHFVSWIVQSDRFWSNIFDHIQMNVHIRVRCVKQPSKPRPIFTSISSKCFFVVASAIEWNCSNENVLVIDHFSIRLGFKVAHSQKIVSMVSRQHKMMA